MRMILFKEIWSQAARMADMAEKGGYMYISDISSMIHGKKEKNKMNSIVE